MADLACPRCGTTVEQHWDWCEACGFDPEGMRRAGPEVAGSPPPPPPPPHPLPPAPAPAFSGPLDSPSSARTALVVAVGVTAILVVVGVVLLGGSGRHRTVETVSSVTSTSSVSSTSPAVTSAPTAELGAQYLAAVQPANAAELAYLRACGCPDHPDMTAAIAALPALKAALETELTTLAALADRAPEPAATDLRALVAAKQPEVAVVSEIIALGPSAPKDQLTLAFRRLAEIENLRGPEAARVRRDLGLPPATVTPLSP